MRNGVPLRRRRQSSSPDRPQTLEPLLEKALWLYFRQVEELEKRRKCS